MTFSPLVSDFYGFEEQLSAPEKEALRAAKGELETVLAQAGCRPPTLGRAWLRVCGFCDASCAFHTDRPTQPTEPAMRRQSRVALSVEPRNPNRGRETVTTYV